MKGVTHFQLPEKKGGALLETRLSGHAGRLFAAWLFALEKTRRNPFRNIQTCRPDAGNGYFVVRAPGHEEKKRNAGASTWAKT
jgi:hypothetical protein